MGCTNKTKSRCGSKVRAICVNYAGTLPAYSLLEVDDCLDVQEVIEDIYGVTTTIKSDINTTALDFGCLTAPTVNISKNVLQLLLDTICTMQDIITTMQAAIDTLENQVEDLQNSNCPPT